jgi:hypothetical protein
MKKPTFFSTFEFFLKKKKKSPLFFFFTTQKKIKKNKKPEQKNNVRQQQLPPSPEVKSLGFRIWIYLLACLLCLSERKRINSRLCSLMYAFVTARIFHIPLYSKFSLRILQYSAYLALASTGKLAAVALASAACNSNFLVFGI